MALTHNRVFNFSAGPCTLPEDVLSEIEQDLFNYKGHGMSVMEMSHRSSVFMGILDQTVADFRALANVPDNYHVMFLQGGASLQNSMLPLNLWEKGKPVEYVVTGYWGQKTLEAAEQMGEASVLYQGKSDGYKDIAPINELTTDPSASYLHYVSNETIQGVQYPSDPTFDGTLVCDMSSEILSRPFDVSKYAMIYAGAQKNMGPAGATLVIIRDDLLPRLPENLQVMLDYGQFARNGSMPNTPPCWSIYVCGLVYQHLLRNGGLEAVERKNIEKSKLLYDAIDASDGFYKGHATRRARSRMNVTFALPTEDLTKQFVKEAADHNMDGMAGHRSLGGIRASIYNAFPVEGAKVMAEYMRDFACKNG